MALLFWFSEERELSSEILLRSYATRELEVWAQIAQNDI